MIIDLSTSDDGTVVNADLCIVGAGAAGISLALEFIDSGLSVVLVEAGGEQEEPETQTLYDGEVADQAMHPATDRYRVRRFGGTTGIWAGRCVPFDPIDFEARPWISSSGWPIGYDDLAGYYPKANALCEAGEFAYTAEAAFPRGMRRMLARFAGGSFTDNTLERFSCPTDFGQRYRKRLTLARNLTVLLHANATELRTRADGRVVDGLEVKTLTGRTHTVRATRYVLATGGLETPRLLLASRDHHAEGIGNLHDQVGRHYMCHIAGAIGDLQAAGSRDDVRHGYQVSDEGIYCRRRFALTAEAQRRLEVGNFVARMHHPHVPNPAHGTGALSTLFFLKPLVGYEYQVRLFGGGKVSAADWLRHARNVALDAVGTAGFFAHLIRDRILADRIFPTVIIRSKTNLYTLDFHSEQEPNPESRVGLAADRDVLGMPKIRVDWRYTSRDIETVRHAIAALATDLESSGSATLRYDPDEVEDASVRYGAFGGHHIGTTRMSASPRTGVVDADCRVHGTENLFVAGSAAFTTSGQANPTLTIVALTLRLADHLRQEFAQAA